MATGSTEWANGRLRSHKQRQSAFAFLGEIQARDGVFDMAEVDAEGVYGAVVAWVNQGYAISFGRTKDGGALGVHLHAGGDKQSYYFGSAQEVEDFLSRVAGSGGPPAS